MKKLVLMAAAIVAVSFASCGNKAANADQAVEAETTAVAAEVEAVAETEAEAVAEVADSAAVAVADSAAVVTE